MMIARPDKQFHDPEAAQRRLDRDKRDDERQRRMLAGATESAGVEPRWYVLAVRNRSEMTVANALEEKNICAWVPTKKGEPRRYRHRKIPGRAEPIFAGYVFVLMPMNAYAVSVLASERFLHGVLGDKDKPIPIDGELIRALNDMVLDGVFGPPRRDMGAKTARERFALGDPVQIKTGPFALFKATIDGYRGTRQVRCLVKLLGYEVPATISIANLKEIV